MMVGVLSAALPFRTADTNADRTEEVLDTARRFQSAALHNDVKFLNQLFDDNVTHFHPGEAYRFQGRERLVHEFSSSASRQENASFEMIEPKVQFPTSDVAVLTYYISENWMERGNFRSASEKATEVYVRKDNRWIMVHSHYSATP